jgi:hypothetical protein
MINARYRRTGDAAGRVSEVAPRPLALEADPTTDGWSHPSISPRRRLVNPRASCAFVKRRVPDRDRDQPPIACFRAADGTLVAEVDLTGGRDRRIDELIAYARALGAEKLWAHAHVIDAEVGFARRGAYTRLQAERPPPLVELPSPPLRRVAEIQRACFAGVWGHHNPGRPDPNSHFVGLHEGGAWVGICEVDPEMQWIDGPGVIPLLRTPGRYARLVCGAAAYLRNEPVTLETWGDAASTLAAYAALGFEVVHSVSGWELDLGRR